MSKLDKLYWGILFGVLIPVIFGGLFILTIEQTQHLAWEEIWFTMKMGGQFLLKMFIVSITPNLLLLFVAYKKDWWKLSRGFIVATLVLFGVVLCFM